MRLLLAEDDIFVLDALVDAFRKKGIEVTTVKRRSMIKLRCIGDEYNVVTYVCVFLQGKAVKTKAKGLTKGKLYVGYPVSVTDGGFMNSGVDTNIFFLIYNDDYKWHKYLCDLFEPSE